MTEADQPSQARRRLPFADRIAVTVTLLLVWNAGVLWLAYNGISDHEVGNDPAGRGMASGFAAVYAIVSGIAVAVLAVPILVTPWRPVRLAFLALLVIASLLTPFLL